VISVGYIPSLLLFVFPTKAGIHAFAGKIVAGAKKKPEAPKPRVF